jgi:hypothetical protein
MGIIDIRLQFRRIASSLAAQAEVAGGSGHASTTGNIREVIVRKFLKPHLPRSFDIRSGVIVDGKQNQSRQQDCVIVDTRLPLVDIGSDTDAVLIAESVVATIEIKSYLGTAEIEDTLKSIAITRSLLRSGEQEYHKGGALIKVPKALPILTYVFAYDGLELATVAEKVGDFAHTHKDGGVTPEAVCILKKGVLLRSPLMPVVSGNTVRLPPLNELKLEAKPLAKDALFAFYRRFIDDVMPLRMINFDIDAYYADTGLE